MKTLLSSLFCVLLAVGLVVGQTTGTLATTGLNIFTLLQFMPGYVSNGTKFTMTGCSATAPVGGATAGTFTSGTSGTCTVVITMAGADGLISPTGWSCFANDLTTTADKLNTTVSTTRTATIAGTTVTGDVVSFGCVGF